MRFDIINKGFLDILNIFSAEGSLASNVLQISQILQLVI